MNTLPGQRRTADVDRAARRERLLIAALTSTMVLLVLDSSIVGVMLPSMTRDLELSGSQGAWLVSAYLLTLAVFLPLGGRLSDAYGPVNLFRIGMAGFILSSLGIALIPDFAGVVGCRAIAGISAAMLMPATLSVLTQAVREQRRAAAMAIYTGVGQGFALIGPAVGGICAQFVGWQWGFLINVPVGVVGIVLIELVRPDTTRHPVRSWDLLGVVLVVGGLSAIMTALLQAPEWGWSSPTFLAVAAVGIALTVGFVVHARRAADPILDIGLFANRRFATNTAALAALGFAMTIATIYGATALQDALHLTPAEAGISLLPLVIPLLVTTRTVGARYETLGLRRVVVAGSLALAAGLAIAAIGFAVSSLVVVSVGMVFAGSGIGAILSPLTTATIATAPADQRGQASGLMTTCRQTGGVVGIAVFSAVIVDVHGTSGTAVGFAITALVMAAAAAAAYRGLAEGE
ncbi:MFS transporter [Gordonia sp. CPCC 205515]|uniref:MFS transporter n=1 Tax=Gordonia sp. CPCC 205515 TaxID=3140791 RepID=UPI003AF3F158